MKISIFTPQARKRAEYSKRYKTLKLLVAEHLASDSLPSKIEASLWTLKLIETTSLHPIDLIEYYLAERHSSNQAEFVHYGYELDVKTRK